MKKNLIFISLLLLIAGCANSPQVDLLVPTGAYLGQNTPGDIPEVFAPGIVSTGMFTRDIAMTPDGKEIYFCISLANYTFATILVTKDINGKWTQPEVMEQMRNPQYMNLEPCISPDGKKFFFLSNRPDMTGNEPAGDEDIWVMDRNGNEWSEPYNLGEPVNSEYAEFFPSVTKEGTLYFTRSEKESGVNYIFRSRMINGKYQEPEKLPPQVNSGLTQFNAFIDPDEKYLIVPVNGRTDSFGSTDYYVVYRNPDDTWTEPVNMGNKINTVSGLEFSPYVSPDGKYFFFMSSRIPEKEKWPKELTFSFLREMFNKPGNGNSSIYWVDSKFISENKPTLTNQKNFAFVTFVSDNLQERAVKAFIKSVRELSGDYINCKIYVVVGDQENLPCNSLMGENVFLIPLKMDSTFRNYPLALKAFAAAQVEKQLRNEDVTLAWFDPSTLVLKSPGDINLDGKYSVSVRPVTLLNSIGLPAGTEPNDFWAPIYNELGLNYKNVPIVETIADRSKIQAYFNCEIFSFDPRLGICDEWKNLLTKLLKDENYQKNVCNTPQRRLLLHQAVLSSVIISKVPYERIKTLSIKNGYPFNQHERLNDSLKAKSLNELNAIILDYVWEKDPDWINNIPVINPLKDWLNGAYADYLKNIQ